MAPGGIFLDLLFQICFVCVMAYKLFLLHMTKVKE